MEKKTPALYSIISSDTFLEGTLFGGGGFRIDGRLKGRIECMGTVVISSRGKVEGEVVANEVFVAGELAGNVFARDCLHLCENGRLRGDIVVGKLVIEPGVIFDGNCRMFSVQALPEGSAFSL